MKVPDWPFNGEVLHGLHVDVAPSRVADHQLHWWANLPQRDPMLPSQIWPPYGRPPTSSQPLPHPRPPI